METALEVIEIVVHGITFLAALIGLVLAILTPVGRI